MAAVLDVVESKCKLQARTRVMNGSAVADLAPSPMELAANQLASIPFASANHKLQSTLR